MGQETIKSLSGREVSVRYADSVPASILKSVALPQAVTKVAQIAKTGLAVADVVIEAITATSLKLTFYDEYHRICREDVIPVAAMYRAHQDGRDMLRGILDDDLMNEAEDELKQRRKKRLGY